MKTILLDQDGNRIAEINFIINKDIGDNLIIDNVSFILLTKRTIEEDHFNEEEVIYTTEVV
jgi:hypothetical protein